jgi:hypothetical protein
MLDQLEFEGSWRDSLAILWYSLLSAERRGDHQGLDLEQGRLSGAKERRRVVILVEDRSNHLASESAVTRGGQGGRENSFSLSCREGQSKRAQCGVGGGIMMDGG